MKVIITITFCCDNLWKSKFMALEKPGKLREFFLLLFGHPGKVQNKNAKSLYLYSDRKTDRMQLANENIKPVSN